jgi:Fe-S-cluster containining protein
MGLLSVLFGPRIRLPQDQLTKIPRSVRKRAREYVDGMQKAIDEIAAMPGLADIGKTKQLPRGLSERVEVLVGHYDRYADEARAALDLREAPRMGTPEGAGACLAAPMGVFGVELLRIYRHVRTWHDFPAIAQRLGTLAEALMKEIQSRHKGKDPEKIRLGSSAVGAGRLAFSQRGEACPFLDGERRRCRIWDVRPIVCRMHHITTDPAWSDPRHAAHKEVRAKNLRLPIRQHVGLQQIDKRMGLSLSPFLYVGLLQLLQLGGGELIPEVGEAPRRMQMDGRVAQRANRNVRHAKKFQKKKKRKR